MTTYYVGAGGNDGWSGTSWAHRLETLNGAEDKPIAAGDTVYVGPGVYRELLTCDVSGTAGNPITYIADVTGENTDGVGGVVRITGSDNDQSTTRNNCIDAVGIDYRTFRGFHIDTSASVAVDATSSPTNWIIEDCAFSSIPNIAIYIEGDAQSSMTIRRCVFLGSKQNSASISINSTAGIQNAGHDIYNCMFVGTSRGVYIDDVGGIDVDSCLFFGLGQSCVRVADALPVGYTAVTVENCILQSSATAIRAVNLGEIVEDYNTLFANQTDRINVAAGGNSQTYPALLSCPLLHAGASQTSGFRFPWWFGDLSEWSQVGTTSGASGSPDEDLWGIQRPVDNSKRSWGPCQFQDAERDTLTTRGGSAASLVVHEPGHIQMWVPTSNVQTTISTYAYRLAGYSSITNPQMIIKQPGQSDRVTTDAAAASQWNLLSDTFTPAANPPYVVVELVSNEGATSTSTSITSTSTTVTSTSTSTTSTSTSTTSTSISTSTTTLAYNVYFDDLSVS